MITSVCTYYSWVCLLASILPEIFTLWAFKEALPECFRPPQSSSSSSFLLELLQGFLRVPRFHSALLPRFFLHIAARMQVTAWSSLASCRPTACHCSWIISTLPTLLLKPAALSCLHCLTLPAPTPTGFQPPSLSGLSHIELEQAPLYTPHRGMDMGLVTPYSPEWCLALNKHLINRYWINDLGSSK